MTLSLAQLVTLRELRRLGTMVAVAERLGYTAGAVSQQIATLEKTVGAGLIARVGRNVVLTDSGTVLAEHAEKILAAEQSALDALQAVHGELAAPLRLGTFGSTAAALLPPVVALQSLVVVGTTVAFIVWEGVRMRRARRQKVRSV
jgi:DNA-binding transcriptional LysR family regulator